MNINLINTEVFEYYQSFIFGAWGVLMCVLAGLTLGAKLRYQLSICEQLDSMLRHFFSWSTNKVRIVSKQGEGLNRHTVNFLIAPRQFIATPTAFTLVVYLIRCANHGVPFTGIHHQGIFRP